VKRAELVRNPEAHGWLLLMGVNDFHARKICRDLEIDEP